MFQFVSFFVRSNCASVVRRKEQREIPLQPAYNIMRVQSTRTADPMNTKNICCWTMSFFFIFIQKNIYNFRILRWDVYFYL